MSNVFATAINCMDGRAQQPVIDYIRSNFKVDHVDMITEPGPNKILADNTDTAIIASIRKRIARSVEKHLSETIVIAGHYDCAGNPVPENIQKEHLKKAMETVILWDLPVKKIITLWLDERFVPHEIL